MEEKNNQKSPVKKGKLALEHTIKNLSIKRKIHQSKYYEQTTKI
jgi:hypothetical protein